MSDQDQEPLTSASRGADEQAPSGTGDPTWSGTTSGAEGAMPQDAGAGGSSSTSSGSGSSSSGSMGSQVKEQADKVIGTATQKVSSVADQATSSTDAGMAKAASGLDTLAGTIRDKSQSLGGGQVESMATAAADRLQSGAEMLRSQNTDQLVSELEALIRRRPVESLLVAAGVGFVLSKALR
jgi:ElaB/YqjD/DUF883 family membrane-anchored ribosome-binding protein